MEVERLRTKAAWAAALPFFYLARPTAAYLVVGGVIGGLGVALRAWAAGTVAKNERLTTTGPYAHVRHPLYLGSLLVGLGLTLAGGHWIWPAIFLAFYAAVYTRVMAAESRALAEAFGEAHRAWAEAVPALVPRLHPYRDRAGDGPAPGFTLARYLRNAEWETLTGFLVAWAVLVVKWRLG